MHLAMSIPQLLTILAIVVLIFGTRRFSGIDEEALKSQLRKELGRMPVYSAETTGGKEAEFIRERLPKRFPMALVLAGIAILGAVAWWLTR